MGHFIIIRLARRFAVVLLLILQLVTFLSFLLSRLFIQLDHVLLEGSIDYDAVILSYRRIQHSLKLLVAQDSSKILIFLR